MAAPRRRLLRLACALACAGAATGVHESSSLLAEGQGGLRTSSKREMTQLVSSLQQQRLRQARQQGAAASSASAEVNIDWKKKMAAGATIAALSKGGAHAFQVKPQVPDTGKTFALADGGWPAVTKTQIMGLEGVAGGTVMMPADADPFAVMAMQSEVGIQATNQYILEQAHHAWANRPPTEAVSTSPWHFMAQDDEPGYEMILKADGSGYTTPYAVTTTKPDTRVRLGDKLGAGAFAEVFQGNYFPEDNPEEIIPVAVKKIPRTTENERMVKREIRMMYELEQSRDLDYSVWPFLRLYGYEEHDQESHLLAVMELADGDLENMVMKKTFDEVNFIDRTRIFYELTYAVTVMNLQGFLHRDVKPQNVFLKGMVAADGRQEYSVKLGDFGLSCAVAGDIDILCLNDWERTQPAGSALYMSRERFMPEYADMLIPGKAELGLKCDVFSLGMILYQLVFLGRAPLAYWKYAIPPSEEFPQGSFDNMGWAEGFDLQADPNFRYARASTKAPGSAGDVNNILIAALDMMEVLMDQDVHSRPLPEDVYNQGFEKLSEAFKGAEENIRSADTTNQLVSRRIGEILWSAAEDPEVIAQMGKSVS